MNNEENKVKTEVPQMMTIRQVARTGILPEHALRTMAKCGQLPSHKQGNRVYINYNALVRQLNSLSAREAV